MAALSALASPSNVQCTWNLQRGAPSRAGELTHVIIRSLSAPDGRVQVEANPGMTVLQLKTRIAHSLNISPRKQLQLQWWGTPLEDNKTLQHHTVSDGGELQLRLRSRAHSELEGMRGITQVRVRSDSAVTLVTGLTPLVTVHQLKRNLIERKALGLDPKTSEETVKLFYSPFFAPMPVFGNPLDEAQTLGSFGILDDDILFCLMERPSLPDGKDKGKDGKDAKKGKGK
uniref:Ubiquitin-like domain-containing protein n=1 Tax=Coccolithus braarudii TaxID=221442 RepID=A0A7S0LGV7_9EUKA